MRVKLSVHRHRLPPATVVWAIADDQLNPGTTISKLLSQIDEIIPLEAEDWGFEDYTVEVDGFECMHFQPVGDVIKEGDIITIRPLQTPEVRGRTLSGRHQISENGQHLVDGVPFGRPLLRKPNRPNVRIPSKKRPLPLDDAVDDELTEEAAAQLLSILNGEDIDRSPDLGGLKVIKRRKLNDSRRVSFEPTYDPNMQTIDDDYDDDDDDDDEDFLPGAEGGEDSDSEDDDSANKRELNGEIENMEKEARRIESMLRVMEREIGQLDGLFEAEASQQAGERTTSSVPVPLLLDTPKQHSITSSNAIDTIDSDESDDSDEIDEFDEDSDEDSDSDDTSSSSSSDADSDSDSESDSDETDSASDSESSSNSDATPQSDSSSSSGDSGPDILSSAKAENTAMHQTASKVPNANDIKTDTSNKPVVSAPGDGKSATQKRNARRRQTKKLKALIDSGVLPIGSGLEELRAHEESSHVAANAQQTKAAKLAEDVEFQTRREKLLASLSTGAIDALSLEPVTIETEETTLLSKKRELPEDVTMVASSPAEKRARLDVASTRRLVLGSLGIRAPKANNESLRSKAKSVQTLATSNVVLDETGPDSDAWKGKLQVTAVECVNEGITLIPPPYPFVQRWDPSQQTKRLKRSSRQSYSHDDYIEYDDSGITAFVDDSLHTTLNYDEDDDKQTAQSIIDMPALPADIDTLSAATVGMLIPGTIIAFKQLEMGESTNWQPVISDYRTARIDSAPDDKLSLDVTLAYRDIPRKCDVYDDNGNRILSRFEVQTEDDIDEDEDDTGERTINFNDLIAPKILVVATLPSEDAEMSTTADSAEQSAIAGADSEIDAHNQVLNADDGIAADIEREDATDDSLEDQDVETTEQKGRSCVHM